MSDCCCLGTHPTEPCCPGWVHYAGIAGPGGTVDVCDECTYHHRDRPEIAGWFDDDGTLVPERVLATHAKQCGCGAHEFLDLGSANDILGEPCPKCGDTMRACYASPRMVNETGQACWHCDNEHCLFTEHR